MDEASDARGRVLIVAGSDSGGGAGIQADLKTVTVLGGYGATAITALTAQNTLGVEAVEMVSPDFVAHQMRCVLADIGADCVKIGMLGNAAVIEAVARALDAHAPSIPVVLDPVMVAKGGAALLDRAAHDALREQLLPRATVLTPNLPEAESLLGREITDDVDREEAARALMALGPSAVLLKGGHGAGPELVDVLVDAEGAERFVEPRIETRHTHGTGCTLASAIATGLARGASLRASVAAARRYVRDAIRRAPGFGAGHGPLGHGEAR